MDEQARAFAERLQGRRPAEDPVTLSIVYVARFGESSIWP